MVQDPAVQGKCDVYAFACVVYELLTRQVPWPPDKPFGRDEVVRAVLDEGWRPELVRPRAQHASAGVRRCTHQLTQGGRGGGAMTQPLWVSPSLASLLRDCWSMSPAVRPSMAQVVVRLESLPAWSADGRVEAAAAALAEATQRREQQRQTFELACSATGGRLSLLLRVAGSGECEAVHVGAAGLSIGRAAANSLRLLDRSVSRQHAQVRVTPAGFVLTDCGSSNGTSVNWNGVPPGGDGVLLQPRDTITCGGLFLRVVLGEVGDDAAGDL